mmetsp:Transcript_11251/g.14617  ORF Transcript_11251/g.14617 Transcript_11251/m.14617 type:complete len:240 (+) Transcript_11251:1507-2226(+)
MAFVESVQMVRVVMKHAVVRQAHEPDPHHNVRQRVQRGNTAVKVGLLQTVTHAHSVVRTTGTKVFASKSKYTKFQKSILKLLSQIKVERIEIIKPQQRHHLLRLWQNQQIPQLKPQCKCKRLAGNIIERIVSAEEIGLVPFHLVPLLGIPTQFFLADTVDLIPMQVRSRVQFFDFFYPFLLLLFKDTLESLALLATKMVKTRHFGQKIHFLQGTRPWDIAYIVLSEFFNISNAFLHVFI